MPIPATIECTIRSSRACFWARAVPLKTASVAGLGGVTIRVAGRSSVVPGDSEVPIEALGEAARRLAAGGAVDGMGSADGHGHLEGRQFAPGARADAPLREAVADLEGSFIEALGRGDARAAVGFLLDLDSTVSGRIRHG